MKHLKVLPLVILTILFVTGTVMATSKEAPKSQAVVDINQASVAELAELPYVGPKRASLIIERRQQQPFTSVDELLEIKGIGPKTLEKIRPHVAVSGSAKKHP